MNSSVREQSALPFRTFRKFAANFRSRCGKDTNYMVLLGLSKYGYEREAYEIACNYVDAVTEAFVRYGSLYENYSPEKPAPGIPAKNEFVGWTGIPPIAVLIEYVLGIRADSVHNKIVWHINRLEKHGIKGYRFGNKTVDLICEARKSADEKPVVHITGDVKVEIVY